MKPTTLGDYDATAENGVDKVTNNQQQELINDELSDSQPVKPSVKNTQEFQLPNLRAFIDKMGLITNWEQSFICPCVNPMTLAPNPTCSICHGTGRGYLPAKTGVKIAITGNNKGKRVEQAGTFDEGGAQGTVQMGYRVSTWDRISIPDAFVRQQYMFNVTPQRVQDGMMIPYDVKEVLYAVAMNPETKTDFHNLMPIDDYQFDRESNKFYPNEALLGLNISLIINVTMRFIVSNVLKELRYQYTEKDRASNPRFDELPRLIQLKREEVFVNNMPLVNPSNDNLNTKAENTSIPVTSATDTDSGFGLS